MSFGLEFDPLVPLWALAAAMALALGFTLFAFAAKVRGALLRALAVIALALCIANPIVVQERREMLPDVAVLVIDRTESLSVDGRAAEAEAAAERIRAAAAADPTLELVEAEVSRAEDGTRLFEAVSRALGEAPRDRLAGVFVVTDGQVHDAPESAEAFAPGAPLHALVVGDPAAADRRLEIVEASEYGIVGERTRFSIRVDDPAARRGDLANVVLTLDGGDPFRASVRIGEESGVEFVIPHRGPNVVEIVVEPGQEELTLANNRAALSVTGVRDRLRVLLVTGMPHQGARDWRNLLKSDPTVDLVHFTILRPLHKQFATPTHELALIEFPTRQLFVDKLAEFDLVILDRYEQDEQVLPSAYLDNISRYVEDGGALLVNVGPPFAGSNSLSRTLLASVLPARPTGGVYEQPYRPAISEIGARHPVTRGLAPPEGEEWGSWLRFVEADALGGHALLEGPNAEPLLLLDRVREGRVGLLLSDQAWLWARGYEGGGPHVELFRRLSHWLMKEPDLEEELLTATIAAGEVRAQLTTMADRPPQGAMRSPTGRETPLDFVPAGPPGVFAAQATADETGLYQFSAGALSAIAASGPLNPLEFSDLRATGDIVRDAVRASGGGVFMTRQNGEPQIRRVRAGNETTGRDWAGLVRNERSVTRERLTAPAAPALLLAAIVLALFGATWRREGK